MCRAGRMAHQEDARRIPAEFRSVVTGPCDRSGNIICCLGIDRVVGETVTYVDTGNAVPRQIVQDVRIDLPGTVAMSADERATMHEQNNRWRRRHFLRK